MQHLIYTGIQRSTKLLNDSITRVTLDVDGELTVLGTVVHERGSPVFSAVLTNGEMHSFNHNTKKRAGGALKKLHDGADFKNQRRFGAEQTSGALVETNEQTVATVDDEQAKKDKRNARRRELRAIKKESEKIAELRSTGDDPNWRRW